LGHGKNPLIFLNNFAHALSHKMRKMSIIGAYFAQGAQAVNLQKPA
jgi:hypothetical protein